MPILRSLAGAVLLLLIATGVQAQEEGVEPVARGPIHEAFASPVDGQPGPGQLIDREPPPQIEEMPADEKPEGDNVQWLPGYWAWDEARGDFLWVSGFWRIPPPGRSWVPGSWRSVGAQWQWTAGFWTPVDDGDDELPYLPPPPPSIESGPSTPPPGDDYVYTPGTFVYTSNRYVWRPGVWVVQRPGWVWIPACYRWTPGGYIFVAGYWDYPLAGRGCLFAPVYIDRRISFRPRWRYVPRHVVFDDALYGAMFVRTGYSHYYFGDYFEARFTTLGYRSWFSVSIGRGYTYDPLFTYYRHSYRRDPYWAPAIREVYVARYAGHIPRPPVTVVNNVTNVNVNIINNPVVVNRYTNIVRSTNITNVTNVNNTVVNVKNINRVNNNNTTVVNKAVSQRFSNLKPVAADQKEAFIRDSRAIQEVSRRRMDAESELARRGAPLKANDAPRTVKLDVNRPGTRPVGRTGAPNDAKGPPPPALDVRTELPGRPSRRPPNVGATSTGKPGTDPRMPGGPGKPPGLGTPGGPGKPPGLGTPGGPGKPPGLGTPGGPGKPPGLGTPGGPGKPPGLGTPGGPGKPPGLGTPGGPGKPPGLGTPGGPGKPPGLGTPGGPGKPPGVGGAGGPPKPPGVGGAGGPPKPPGVGGAGGPPKPPGVGGAGGPPKPPGVGGAGGPPKPPGNVGAPSGRPKPPGVGGAGGPPKPPGNVGAPSGRPKPPGTRNPPGDRPKPPAGGGPPARFSRPTNERFGPPSRGGIPPQRTPRVNTGRNVGGTADATNGQRARPRPMKSSDPKRP